MTSQFLVEHARENVWCAPDQDSQLIFKPFPLSPTRGSRRDQKIEWQAVPLPNEDDAFYVYQIGNVHPGLLGLFPKVGTWITAQQQCNIQGMIIDVYTLTGLQLPRFEVWLGVMYDRNLIMAIKSQGETLDLEKEELFIRFYSNAFFQSSRSDNLPLSGTVLAQPAWYEGVPGDRASSPGDVIVEGLRMTSRSQLLELDRKFTEYNALGVGRAYAFYNGRFVNELGHGFYTAQQFVKGDWAEIVYDGSIIDVVDFPVSKLLTFESQLDSVRKYLLHRTEWIDYIQFEDDLDIFIHAPVTAQHSEGIYYHRGQVGYANKLPGVGMRMVTHQDYSIPVAFVQGYNGSIPALSDTNAFVVRLHVRASGFKRPLVDEHQRIKELYKLKDADRVRAMIGLSSSLDCWRAPNLEASLYTGFMRSRTADFALLDVEHAYGYNAISKLVGNSPLESVPSGSQRLVSLPRGLWKRSTIYEYNAAGYLLGWYPSAGAQTWVCQNAACAFIEGRIGIGGAYLDTAYAEVTTALDPDYDYAFFKVRYQGGKPGTAWQECVEGVDYVITDDVVHWNIDLASWYTAIRSSSHFLTYAIDVDDSDGLLIFTLQSNEDDPYAPANRDTVVLPAQVDLIMNGRSLVRGVDYWRIGNQWVVYNKEYRRRDGQQRIVIRGMGLPRLVDGEWVTEAPIDQGFIQYGQLSHNKRYDLRDDKVQRTVVRGGVVLPSSLSYPEDQLGVNVAGVVNGDPYAVTEVIVPIKEYVLEPTYTLRDASMARDKEVSDYMTQFLPEPVQDNPNPIPERYEIYSPFTAKIMHDLINGYLVLTPELKTFSYSNNLLKDFLKNYLYLLDYEPTRLGLDDRYVSIHPHELYTVVEMEVYQHHLLKRAVRVFLNDAVNLSHFVALADNFEPVIPS